MKILNYILKCWVVCYLLFSVSCTKLVQISPPANTITTAESFGDSSDANAAVAGIYRQLSYLSTGNVSFGNGLTTQLCGLSADEFLIFGSSDQNNQFYQNSLQSNNVGVNIYWSQAYSDIYQTNACIEGLQASSGLGPNVKIQLIGESKFLRALCYFYLVTLFGDIPYVTSTQWTQTATIARIDKKYVFQNIIADLKDAKNALRSDYSLSNGERIRANKWTAGALLARVYLYTGEWANAQAESDSIIKNADLFGLDTLNGVFHANGIEAILQWQTNGTSYPFNATNEGYSFVPYDHSSQPYIYLNADLLAAFEAGDHRRDAWVDSTVYNGTTYYYPYKYKVGSAQIVTDGSATEYYMVLRLAEQYLIRAEAEAQNNELNDAIVDLNVIRERAGLPDLPTSLNQSETFASIAQERRVELFAEWGHRWLDLVRTGKVDSVMSIATPQKGGKWSPNWKLYPIPLSEMRSDPNLTQNPGY